jgi:hypothetical protein
MKKQGFGEMVKQAGAVITAIGVLGFGGNQAYTNIKKTDSLAVVEEKVKKLEESDEKQNIKLDTISSRVVRILTILEERKGK